MTGSPAVRTAAGVVLGVREGGAFVFRGLRYAEPPVGERAFAPPVPVHPWDGERDASRFGPIAAQPGGAPGSGSDLPASGDDCLSLNVWTPELGAAALPVVVWLHGGGFINGSGAEPLYDGATFARDGVVCVTVNYRLGAAGYLLVEGSETDNFGLLDQIEALRWVQENIAAFGGDPTRVTVFGESAGAHSTCLLLGAPAARGLIRRAICQSGHPDTIPYETARRLSRELHAMAGVAVGDVDGLRALSSERLVELTLATYGAFMSTARMGEVGIQPVAGGSTVPRPVLDAVEQGSAAGVDLLVGHTRDEFLMFVGTGLLAFVGTDPDQIDAAFELSFPGRGAEAMRAYHGRRPGADATDLLIALESDRMCRIPSIRLADAQSSHRPNTWFYRFSWASPAPTGKVGAGHGAELPFVWDAIARPAARPMCPPDAPQDLADAVHRAWTTFATTGDPGHAGLPTWPRHTVEDRAVLDFDSRIEVLHDPDGAERLLWDGLPTVR